MSDKIKISMVMIAKDEESNVPTCFASWWDDVDEAILVDTGSSDGTIAAAKEFAKSRGDSWVEVVPDPGPDGDGAPKWLGPGGGSAKLVIGRFEWIDDFAAARNYAQSLAHCDWHSWIDLDDVAHGIPHLRELAAGAAPDVAMLYAIYEYALDELGNCFCELWRERLSRAGRTQWIGRVHECQIGQGTMVRVEKEKVRWTHRRSVAEARDRNEKLLRAWVEDDPNDARAVSYLAFELMGSRIEHEREGEKISEPDRDKITESVPYFQRYLEMPNQPPDARAQSVRRYSQVLMTLGRFDEAEAVSLKTLGECPWWPDTLLTLAELTHEKQDWRRVIDFAEQVLHRGQPDTMLIVNPEEYTLRPRTLIASALASSGKLEEAVKIAQEVVTVNPNYMGMSGQLAEWLGALAQDQAGHMWANSAQLLVLNDEPEKAAVLLNTAPFFSNEHPAIIAARTRVALALSEPYQVEPVTDSPRGQFLLRCLREQMALPPVAAVPDKVLA